MLLVFAMESDRHPNGIACGSIAWNDMLLATHGTAGLDKGRCKGGPTVHVCNANDVIKRFEWKKKPRNNVKFVA
jgi:hypothetical protein